MSSTQEQEAEKKHLLTVSDVVKENVVALSERGFKKASEYFSDLADKISAQADSTLSRAEKSKALWLSLDEFAEAALADLSNIAATTTDDAIRTTVNDYRTALAQSKAFAQTAGGKWGQAWYIAEVSSLVSRPV